MAADEDAMVAFHAKREPFTAAVDIDDDGGMALPEVSGLLDVSAKFVARRLLSMIGWQYTKPTFSDTRENWRTTLEEQT